MRQSYSEHMDELFKNLYKKYRDSVKISIDETDEEKLLADRELKKASKKYAQENFQGKKFPNEDTGQEILVSRIGLDKWDNITKSREQGLSVKKLDEMLKRAKKVKFETDNKKRKFIDGLTYFEQPIDVNGKPYNANIATRDTQGNNSSYYYHYLKGDEKKEPDEV